MRHEREPGEWAEARSQIFALFNRLKIRHDDRRHRIQQAVTGCSSLRLMTDKEHQLLINVLEMLLNHVPAKRQVVLQRLLALGDLCHSTPFLPPEFAQINLEATLSLVDRDSEQRPAPSYPITLIVRQGIELLLKGSIEEVEAVVFLEYYQNQVRLLVWDETLDPFEDLPTIHILKYAGESQPKDIES